MASQKLSDPSRIYRRAKASEDLLKTIGQILKGLEKIPSYSEKARFMDVVNRAKTRAHNLAWDLAGDAKESETKE